MSAEQSLPRNIQEIPLEERNTKRVVSPGAEKWLGKVIPVLDHGFVYLVDYMGNDEAIEQAARVSYGAGTRATSQTEGLIRYLRRHCHTTPFEMVELKFHAKMPIFVARQWVRHRTANINEYSARYSILDREFYIPQPEILTAQSASNRQGGEEVISAEQAKIIRQLLIEDAVRNYDHYEFMLNDDGTGEPTDSNRSMLARELARMDLTLNFYTQWYWKIDLHNLFHFIGLRSDSHAQYEIRVYSEAMAQIVKDVVPIAWKAYEDYELEALKLNKPEIEIITRLAKANGVIFTRKEVLEIATKIGLTNGRERQELLDKFRKLGIVPER